ncbi:MAG: phospholipid carrier-dependent glycosyltransferase [Oscillochloris sp.]|nr:phospholipid carrier-dependent glycosyltransferase [Oscillochloris sp.]
MRTPSRRAAWLPPLLLFALALATRLWALGWGLPYVEHPDEPALVEVVIRMLHDGSLNPRTFLYPSFFYYLLNAVARLHLAWGESTGLYHSAQDLVVKTFTYTSQPQLYLWLRAVSALLGALTVPLLYWLGSSMFDRRVGLLAAAALAVARFHVEHSHYITTDAATGLWTTLALLGASQVASCGSWRGYLLGALGVGLAAGTKYNAGLVCLALAFACLIYLRQAGRAVMLPQLGRLASAGLLSGLVFLLVTPYALLDLSAFLAALRFNTSHYASGYHGDFTGTWPLAQYVAFYWETGLLPTGCLLLLAGLPALLRRRPAQATLLLCASLPMQLILLSYAVHFTRNLLPIFPSLFLMLSAGVVEIADWLRTAFPQRKASVIALPTLALLLLAPQISESAWLLGYWARPYSLVQVAQALQSQPRGMLAAVELNPVQWSGDPVVAPVDRLANFPVDYYRARGYRFLVLDADRYGSQMVPDYQHVQAYGETIFQVADRDQGAQPGPGSSLVDLGEHLELMPFIRRAALFGGSIRLLGYELAPGELRARMTPLVGADAHAISVGQPLQINLYWRALAPLDRDYTLFVHLIDVMGTTVAQRDLLLRHADYPTSRWQVGELVIDSADLPLPALPSGRYQVEIGLYDGATGMLLPSEGGAPVVITYVTIAE